jgi:hypothetical protein
VISSNLKNRGTFLPWLRSALGDPTIDSYQFDRLVARRGPHDLRILITNGEHSSSPSCFQIEEATGDPGAYPLGRWQLAHRDPLEEEVLGLMESLGARSQERVALVLGSEVMEAVLISYAPGRRAVIQYSLDDGRRAIGKVYRPGGSKPAYQLAKRLSSTALGDSVVTPVALVEDLELILWEEVEGMLLSDLFGSEGYISGLSATGKILRRLHLQPCATLAGSTTLEDELGTIHEHISRLRGVFEEEELDPLRSLHSALEQPCAELAPSPESTIHGDFHDRQVIIHDGRPVILDLDGLSAGDPAIDVGNFLAHIDFRVAFERSEKSPLPYHEIFRQGYRIPAGDRRVQISHAISLLRNAVLYLLIPDRHRLLKETCQKIIDQF